ncbi:glycoside hydrolase family 78 protein [Cellulomonas soli]|uniref:alpha-L-rhamnosidase n=1 Tax=Cellulomonas soli TaxID=931535 RepID=A0A512PGS7_9CELL|nr:glycoside hydrolase family 78 protein [Cellulomonas soli]NYI59610.1 alpha-L-rhamnosidase [Cellulomonas soli]GEP70404.1 alpha-L-rhamnosidase [Cellulomonas soli]
MTADLHLDPVVVEHHRTPLGIGERRPRLSWAARTATPGWHQSGYELEVTDPDGTVAAVRTGHVTSDEQVLVAWPAAPLGPCERRAVRVRVWGPGDDAPSAWSEPTVLETGLLEPAGWQAVMVGPRLPATGAEGEPAALLRGAAHVPGDVVRARLRVTAHGVVTVHLNGQVVGQDVLTPGWTTYEHRLRYATHDVTDLLREGSNVLGAHLADGWYRGFLGFAGMRDVYGDRTGVLLQLEVDHADGTRTVLGTDSSWRWTLGPVTRADLYLGETHDTRRELPGWDEPGFDDTGWQAADVLPCDLSRLVEPTGPGVRRTQVVAPVEILTTPAGATVVDLGQNLVGRMRLHLPDAPAGTVVRLRHAEVLEHGELGTRPLRAARQTDEIVLDGRGPRTWEPSFTTHGFRYVEVTGWPGALSTADLEAVVLHTDLRRTGTFACSDPLLDRLHENVVWGMRGNFLDVPTDCPQRDERLGWTGDLQVFAPTAAFLFDTTGMLTGWLADLAADQHADGVVPPYVPMAAMDPHMPPLGAEAGWGDAATLVPWTLYERTGDAGVLRTQWSSMVAWVDAFAARAGDDLDFSSGGFSFGDWLDASAPDDQPWKARVPWQLVATAYLARSARVLSQAAEVVGESDAAVRYGALADSAAARFRAEYLTPSGRAAYPAQTAYALAVAFDLLLPEQRAHAGQLLAEQVAADEFRIGTGFLGTPLVCDALADTGHGATAWQLLLQRECPSWLYAVTMGATTVWERWNSMLPDGSINPGGMTSFNHYAFGAVADFLHRRVAGLAPAAPGYRRLRIAPLPTRSLDWAAATHETPYGTAAVRWERTGDDVVLTVLVPPSTTAQVVLPDGSEPVELAPGEHLLAFTLPPERAAERAAEFSAG